MNPTDLRHVDFDAYRRHAYELRREAMNAYIDRALARLHALWTRRGAPESTGPARTPAQCAG